MDVIREALSEYRSKVTVIDWTKLEESGAITVQIANKIVRSRVRRLLLLGADRRERHVRLRRQPERHLRSRHAPRVDQLTGRTAVGLDPGPREGLTAGAVRLRDRAHRARRAGCARPTRRRRLRSEDPPPHRRTAADRLTAGGPGGRARGGATGCPGSYQWPKMMTLVPFGTLSHQLVGATPDHPHAAVTRRVVAPSGCRAPRTVRGAGRTADGSHRCACRRDPPQRDHRPGAVTAAAHRHELRGTRTLSCATCCDCSTIPACRLGDRDRAGRQRDDPTGRGGRRRPNAPRAGRSGRLAGRCAPVDDDTVEEIVVTTLLPGSPSISRPRATTGAGRSRRHRHALGGRAGAPPSGFGTRSRRAPGRRRRGSTRAVSGSARRGVHRHVQARAAGSATCHAYDGPTSAMDLAHGSVPTLRTAQPTKSRHGAAIARGDTDVSDGRR